MTPRDELLAKAEKGEAQAQLEMGAECEKPWPPMHEQYVASASWYRKAAEQGLAAAQHKLGIACQFGLGVEKNVPEAIKWLSKAAEQADHMSICQLGWIFLNGQDVEKNVVEAMKWFRKSADQGDAAAQNNLGNFYADGRDVPKNDTQAVHWFRKAAEQGHEGAQYALGGMYAEGRGVVKDDNVALNWFQKAADQGHFGARTTLRRWPPRPVQISAKIAATRRVEDLAAIIQADPNAVHILGVANVVMGGLVIALQVQVTRRIPDGYDHPTTCEIYCFHAIDYSIKPMNPAIMMGGPVIELHEKHLLLEQSHLQMIPGGDGEIYRPPVPLKLLGLDQSYVIAERFELRTPIDNRASQP